MTTDLGQIRIYIRVSYPRVSYDHHLNAWLYYIVPRISQEILVIALRKAHPSIRSPTHTQLLG